MTATSGVGIFTRGLRNCFRALAVVAMGWIVVATSSDMAWAKRVALVIGNSAYENAPALANPANDAADMAAALRDLDFVVVEGIDLKNRDMRDKIREFANELRGADIGMLFYAGHAMQVNGKNQLAPVDTRLEFESDLDFETISLEFIQKQMEREVDTILLFLDSCRDNPLTRSFRSASRSSGAGSGLAEEKTAVSGTFIAFATNPGNVALDGKDRNSPFTKAMLNNIKRPGIEISTLMTDVRLEVVRDTNGQQTPWINSSLLGRFYFNEGEAAQTAELDSKSGDVKTDAGASAQTQGQSLVNNQSQSLNKAQIESLAWEAVKDSQNPDELQAFINKFGSGFYGELARLRLKRLQENTATAKTEEKAAEETKVAALEQPKAEDTRNLAEEVDPAQLALKIQTELDELGCRPGRPDGIWGNNSQKALERFSQFAKVRLVASQPSADLLEQLKGYKGDGCDITCPAGQQVSSKGQCFTPRKTAKAVAPEPKTVTRSTKKTVIIRQQQQQEFQPEEQVIIQEQQPVFQRRQQVIIQQQQQPVIIQQQQQVQQPTVGQRIMQGIGVGIGVGVSSCILNGC